MFSASFLDNSHQLLVTGACVALGEVGRCGKLPLPVGEVGSSDSQMTLYSVVDKLVKKLNAQKEPNKASLICVFKFDNFLLVLRANMLQGLYVIAETL